MSASNTGGEEFSSLWAEAYDTFLGKLDKKTRRALGQDDSPLAQEIDQCLSPAAVLGVIQRSMHSFDKFRASESRWGQLCNDYVKPFINVLLRLNDAAGEAASFAVRAPTSLLLFNSHDNCAGRTRGQGYLGLLRRVAAGT
jgi:hypothetical protein